MRFIGEPLFAHHLALLGSFYLSMHQSSHSKHCTEGKGGGGADGFVLQTTEKDRMYGYSFILNVLGIRWSITYNTDDVDRRETQVTS